MLCTTKEIIFNLREIQIPALIHVDSAEARFQLIALSKTIHGKSTDKLIELDRPAKQYSITIQSHFSGP